ncbi:hypothetical protein NX059_009645 [Plenodomus lindquistii]|nr:hypothetical protein NX059_009645 [Plenodomus lindquistii]
MQWSGGGSLRADWKTETYRQKRMTTKVAMEIVSPVLNTANSVTVTLSEFWEAMAVGFAVQKAESCGGHVHVTPANSTRRFTLPELKKIAFATFVTENLVQAILPGTRRANRWCKMNSEHKGGGWYRSTKGKLTASTVVDAQRLISQTLSPADLRDFVQGGERDDRYVLWNFQNIAPFGDAQTCSSTVEFRGGSQFLDRPTTLKWVAFVVAFIHLALKEQDLLQATRIPFIPKNAPEFDTSMTQWWAKIRESARALKVKRFLPEDWRTMRDQA